MLQVCVEESKTDKGGAFGLVFWEHQFFGVNDLFEWFELIDLD